MGEFSFFLPIAKVDEEKRLVSGYATTEAKDSDGEIIELNAVKAALPDYLEYGNIREMHKLNAVGVAAETNLDKKGLYLTAYIADDAAWQKCLPNKLPDGTVLPPVYKGFSIGGRKLDKIGNRITELEMTEISIVDRPANPECKIDIAKSAKALDEKAAGGYLVKVKKPKSPERKALAKMANIIADLAKAGPPAAKDGFSLPAELSSKQPDGVPSVNDSRPNENVTRKAGADMLCEKHSKPNCALCAVEKAQEIMPKPPAANKKKEAKKAAKLQLRKAMGLDVFDEQDFLTLRKSEKIKKSMNSVGSLSYCFDSIRDVQRRLLTEAKREGGDGKDKALAKQLGDVAKSLSAVISQKASHEGEEALTLTDADDQYLASLLGEGFDKMETKSGDPLADALSLLVKRAATPTRAQRMAMAADNVKKARKCTKMAREEIEKVHAMHKASYIAKAAKKSGDSDDFDHTEAMAGLQKAYQEIDKARTFNKAAAAQLEKLARSGQAGTEAGDGLSGFYEVPAGVTDISPDAMSGAKPGSKGSSGVAPDYPGDGSVYSGKAAGVATGDDNSLQKYAKNGHIPAEIAELLLKQAAMQGELEAFKRLPASSVDGRRRPFAFDLTKAAGTAKPQDLQKVLFEGVDVGAINGPDERAHVSESAKVIGNLLTSGHFGKSVLSPEFRGAAGTH